jgi:hypothetical protein
VPGYLPSDSHDTHVALTAIQEDLERRHGQARAVRVARGKGAPAGDLNLQRNLGVGEFDRAKGKAGLELGTGKVLSGLVRRIAKEANATPAGTPDEIKVVADLIKA